MDLSNLTPAKGSIKGRKRIARGTGSGRGGTSTRGHKGAKSRSGYSAKRAFEGGGIQLWKKIPKRGFKNINRVDYVPVNLGRLQSIVDKFNVSTIDLSTLAELKICSKNDKIKILGSGELTAKLNVTAHSFSASAKQAIEALGGNVTQA